MMEEKRRGVRLFEGMRPYGEREKLHTGESVLVGTCIPPQGSGKRGFLRKLGGGMMNGGVCLCFMPLLPKGCSPRIVEEEGLAMNSRGHGTPAC